MAARKVLSGELVVSLLEQMLKSQDEFRAEMRQALDRLRVDLTGRLSEVVSEQRQTNERLDRLEKATVGVGRMIALEARMRRVEERVGIEPPTDR